ncbi:hypothetical protein [Synechococcus sp. MU1625]|uniref:hypothetical protein n=1 Tax=Synechococcus sp. MU1625 TaxID=2508347 RepID=UPI001CF921C5|nr:hypothetical protein [Synechococcus sp. MU1625]MCB4399372.1 hypothetical protein [Synechococcus sp. MU1625]
MPRSENTQLDILTVPWRIAGISSVVFAISLAIWATVTKVPIRVTGQGVYYAIGNTSSFITSDYGKVYLFLEKNAQNQNSAVQFNKLLQKIEKSLAPKVNVEYVMETAENMLELLANIETKSNAITTAEKPFNKEFPIEVQPYQLVAYAESSSKKAALISAIGDRDALNIQYKAQRTKNELLKNDLTEQLNQRIELQVNLDHLSSSKIISKLVGLENREATDEIKTQLVSLDAELQSIKTNLDKANSQVVTRFYDFVNSSLLYSNETIFVQQVSIPRLDYLSPGNLVLSYSKNANSKPREIPIFFNAKDVSTLQTNDRGLISLPGYPRTIYGGIEARVVQRDNLSVVSKQAESYLGLSGFSEFLEYNFVSPTMVKVELLENKDGNYTWTNASPGEKPPTIEIGDKVDMEVITGTITPIEMIVPGLRNILGLTPAPPKEARPKSEQGK